MPRFLWILLAGCSIQADYGKAHVRCDDGVCPAGMTCGSAGGEHAGYCGFPDAAVGGGDGSAMIDAHVPALTCNDPGDALGSNNAGSTIGRANHVAAMCGTAVYNGPDAVYMVTGPRTVSIMVTGDFAVAAYAVTSCAAVTCEGGSAAEPGPLSLSLGSGAHFIVVDALNPTVSGTYQLHVQ